MSIVFNITFVSEAFKILLGFGSFFPWEKKEAKVEEFINLCQGNLSVLHYSLKFTKLSKYVPFLVSDPRDEMNNFVTGVSDNLKHECHSTMIHDNINISSRMSRDAYRAVSFDCCS